MVDLRSNLKRLWFEEEKESKYSDSERTEIFEDILEIGMRALKKDSDDVKQEKLKIFLDELRDSKFESSYLLDIFFEPFVIKSFPKEVIEKIKKIIWNRFTKLDDTGKSSFLYRFIGSTNDNMQEIQKLFLTGNRKLVIEFLLSQGDYYYIIKFLKKFGGTEYISPQDKGKLRDYILSIDKWKESEKIINYAIAHGYSNLHENVKTLVDDIFDSYPRYIHEYVIHRDKKSLPDDIIKNLFNYYDNYSGNDMVGTVLETYIVQYAKKYGLDDVKQYFNNKVIIIKYLNLISYKNFPEEFIDIIFDSNDKEYIKIFFNKFEKNEKNIKMLLPKLLKHPKISSIFLTTVGKSVDDWVPGSYEQLINSIIQDFKASYEYLKHQFMWKDDLDELDETLSRIFNVAIKDPGNAYNIYKKFGSWGFIKNNSDIKDKLIDSISIDSSAAFGCAEELEKMGAKIPEKIINSIAESPGYSASFAKHKDLKDIPPIIINSISTDSLSSLQYTKKTVKNIFGESKTVLIPFENIPKQILATIITDTDTLQEFVERYKNAKEIPEIVLFAIFLNKQVFKNVSSRLKLPPKMFGDEELEQKIIEYIHENNIASYNYFMNKYDLQDEIPELLKPSITEYLKTWDVTNFNIVEYHPELIEELDGNKNFETWYARPKKLAEIYNNHYGVIFHSTDSLDMILKNPKDMEICVTTVKAEKTFGNNTVTLIGRGKVRLLFDFDCYSNMDKSYLKTGLRAGTKINPRNVEISKEFKKQLEKNFNDLTVQDVMQYGVIDSNKYYDEGFIKPSDIEWIGIYIPYGTPKKDRDLELIKKFNLKVLSGKSLYDAAEPYFNHNRQPEPEKDIPGEYEDYENVTPVKKRVKKPPRDRTREKKSKRRIDKYRDFELEEELTLNECVRRKIDKIWEY